MQRSSPRLHARAIPALVGCAWLLAACSPATRPTSAAAPEPEPAAETTAVGESLWASRCAACHDQIVYKAPSRAMLASLAPQNVLRAMNQGAMQAQAAGIDAAGRRAIAEWLTGRSFGELDGPALPPRCGPERGFDPTQPPVSRGWGVDLRNTRFAPLASGGVSAENAETLEVEWVFAYPNAFQARSQPVFGGGAIYVGSHDGTVWALDARTGCLRWSFRASAEVRTGIAITPWAAGDRDVDARVFFGDLLANVYALDARTGQLRWRLRADDHPDATLTGTPAYHDGRLYVPVSSLEVVAAANPQYECCTFRGALLAVDAATGSVVWKAYTTDEPPQPAGRTVAGTRILAPSGAPIWSAPTLDLARGRIYVGTGENYSSPADGNSDALIAFDLATGRKLWVSQQTAHDAWNVACYLFLPEPQRANCPVENGPDYDFGSAPILVRLEDGRDVVVNGQKSGDVVGVDPDTGETLWKTRIGRGGVQGGVHFGIAADGNVIYVPINDRIFGGDDARYSSGRDPAPGIHAVHAATGELLWSAENENVCGDVPFCTPGVSHAISAIPGAVVAGYLDGRIRILAREDGRLLWERNMLGEYESVSGAVAKGGAFSGGGMLVAHGRLYVNAGYGFNQHIPGNALVALRVREEP